MKVIMIDATWAAPLTVGEDLLKYLKDHSITSLALFASVQFLALDKIKEQLAKQGITVKTTKARRTHVEGQILGCDAYHDSYQEPILSEVDAILYVGDGLFHPKALLLAQSKESKIKDILIWDPVSEKMRVITKADVHKQLARMRANLLKFMHATTIGILVTIKPGQQYLALAKKLKEHLATQGKKAYIFIDDTLSVQLLENYPFIQAWVNTACPRIGTDDLVTINQPLINIKEAFDPSKALTELNPEIR